MNTADILHRAGKNLGQAKGRTFLTSLAIAVGACTITLAMAAGAGGRDYVGQQLSSRGLDGNNYIHIFKINDQVEEQPGIAPFIEEEEESLLETEPLEPTDQANSIDYATIQQISQMDGVEEVRPEISVTGLFINLDGQEQRWQPPYINIRTQPNTLVTSQGSITSIPDNHIVLTQDYTKAFGFDRPEQAIGKQINLTLEDGQQQRRTFSFQISDFITDDQAQQMVYLSQQSGVELFIYQSGTLEDNVYPSAIVMVEPQADTEQVRLAIESLGFFAQSNEQLQASFLESVNIAQWGLVGFGALALLASIFGIINTQYISVLERTQQIGLMRAVGASQSDVGRLFRYEAAWIGFLGGGIGIAVAFLLKLLEPFVKSVLQMPEDFTILIFEPLTLLIILAALILIAVASGFFPARRAAKLDPIEALRTE